EVLRYDRYVPERRLGAGLRAEANPFLRQIDLHLQRRYRPRLDGVAGVLYRQRFAGVAAILYRTGEDFQGLHSDREMRWLDDTLIAIVVLGQRRPFVIRERSPMTDINRTPAGNDPGDIGL